MALKDVLNKRWVYEKIGNVLNDGHTIGDWTNWHAKDLEEFGVFQNPLDKNELFFVTDGTGYTDLIRSIYYAQRLTEMTGKNCKIIYIVLHKTLYRHIGAFDDGDKSPNNREQVAWRSDEDFRIINNVVREYIYSDKVKIRVEVTDENFHSQMRQNNKFSSLLMASRCLSTNHFFGLPHLTTKRKPKNKGWIAVWTTEDNKTSVRSWKNPIGWRGMESYLKVLEDKGYEIKRLSYRSSGEEIFDTICNAKMCIGYQGLGNLISRTFFKPIIVFSEREYYSRMTSGHWALTVDKVTDELYDIETIVKIQRTFIKNMHVGKKVKKYSENELKYFGELDENIQRSL